MTPIINMFEEEKSLTCIKEKINVAYTIYTLMLKSQMLKEFKNWRI